MIHRLRSTLAVAVTLAAGLVLAACGDDDHAMGSGASGETTQVEASEAAPQGEGGHEIGVHRPGFQTNQVEPLVTDQLDGERVKDPGMELSYKWQGTSTAPGGGSIVVVAVTNNSDAPLPVDALTPKLRYNTGSSSSRDLKDATFQPIADEAGVDIVGLDQPLGPGATVNAKYPFDVSVGNLWDAEFTIGNVTFKGNLNN